MPARRFFFVASLLTVFLIVGFAHPAFAWLALAGDALLLLLTWFDLVRARRIPLGAERLWPPLLAQGTPVEVRVTITSPEEQRSGTRTVALREALSPALAEAPIRTLLSVGRGAATAWTYRLVPRLRGAPEVGPLSARVLGPWGLAWSQRELLAPEVHHVYPRVRWKGRVGQLLTLAQRHQLGTMPLSTLGVGSEPYALREYLPGDPLAKIHWKATARHGRLVTREETWERGARLVILLDSARTMTGREGAKSKLDESLATALALSRVAAARGDRVTVIAFADRVERIVRITGGARGISVAYRSLFDLEARLTEPAYDLAAAEVLRRETKSATVVLLTSVVDLAAGELLREALLSLERRHRPMLVNLEDPELAILAKKAPQTAPEAFSQVAALEILLANRRLARSLSRAGVRFVSARADRLALATLEAYLALFRVRLGRGRR